MKLEEDELLTNPVRVFMVIPRALADKASGVEADHVEVYPCCQGATPRIDSSTNFRPLKVGNAV